MNVNTVRLKDAAFFLGVRKKTILKGFKKSIKEGDIKPKFEKGALTWREYFEALRLQQQDYITIVNRVAPRYTIVFTEEWEEILNYFR